MTSATLGDRLGGLTKAVTCTVPSPGHFRGSVSQPAAESCGTNRRQGLGLPLILRVPNTQTPGGLTGDCPQQVRPVLSHTAKSVYRSRMRLPPEPPGCRQPQLSSDSAPSLGLGPRGTPWTCCPDRGQQAKMWRATYLVPTRPLHSRLPCSRPSPPTWGVPFPHLTCLVRQVRVLSGRDPWGENSLPLSLRAGAPGGTADSGLWATPATARA